MLSGALDPVKIRSALQDIIEGKDVRFDRLNGLLLSPSEQLTVLRSYDAQYWDGRMSQALADFSIPDYAFEHEQHVDDLSLLHVEFDSPGETIEMWWRVFEAKLPKCWRDPELTVDPDHFGLHGQAQSYSPGVHLVRINLVANWNPPTTRSVGDVRDRAKGYQGSLASSEVLAAYGLHPGLFREQATRAFPAADLAGYVTSANRDRGLVRCPYLRFSSESDGLAMFGQMWAHDRTRDHAAPIVWV